MDFQEMTLFSWFSLIVDVVVDDVVVVVKRENHIEQWPSESKNVCHSNFYQNFSFSKENFFFNSLLMIWGWVQEEGKNRQWREILNKKTRKGFELN